ncbi:MAG: NUDIX hydrolase [Candidatus Baltobacteraceae bacterium]
MEPMPAVLRSERRFQGRVFEVRTDTLALDGKTHHLDIVVHPGSFTIAAMPQPGHLILVRQYRHAARTYMWELPAGSAEGSESCEAGARRELREETGYTADRFELLASLYPTPGFCTELLHVYRAQGLHAGQQQLDEDEAITAAEFSFKQAWRMQASGEIADMKTVLALLWLESRQVK